jgi:co-chaperonin GroES (HSP10)
VSKVIPLGNQVIVRLIQTETTGTEQGDQRVASSGLIIPDSAENTADCEGTVIAVGPGEGFHLPIHVAERIASYFEDISEVCCPCISVKELVEVSAEPRVPSVSVGDRVLFDITLATLAPDSKEDYIISAKSIIARVLPGSPPVELISQSQDAEGYQTK